jgi:hypothetical protein
MASPLFIALLALVPGLGATLAVFKGGQARLPTQLVCAFGLGFVTLSSWGFLLILLRIFNSVTFFTGVVLITLAFYIMGLRRSGLRERASALRDEFREDGLVNAIGLIAVAVFAFFITRGQSALVNFGVANPFRYWADGVEVAEAGQVPAETLQWGQLFAPTVSKLSFNALNGVFTFLSDNPLEVMGPPLVLVLIGSAFAGWAFGRELGLRYTAPLLVILAGPGTQVFKHSLLISPQRWYAGETFARLALVTGLVLAVNALSNKGRPVVAVAAGVALGVAGTTHLIPTGLGIGLLCFYALFLMASERRFRHVLTVGLVAGGIFSLFVLSGLLLSGGDAAFDAVDREREIDTRGGTFDPTRYLSSGVADQPEEIQPGSRLEMNDGWYELPGTIFDDYLVASLSRELDGSLPAVIFIGVGLVALVLLFLAPRSLRPVAIAGFAMWASLLVIAIYMSSSYDTYVPGGFAQRRLWSYATFFPLVVGVALLEAVLQLLTRVRSWIPVIAGGVIVSIALVGARPPPLKQKERKEGADSAIAMNWVSENLPCDARLLASQRTGGTFQAMTGRVAVTEGMAPYLRPEMLTEVVDLLFDSRAFFEDPASNESVLNEYGVDYVLVAKKKYLFDRKPALLGRFPTERVAEAQGLELIHESRLMDVYRVENPGSDEWPDPNEHAGYVCRTEGVIIPEVGGPD